MTATALLEVRGLALRIGRRYLLQDLDLSVRAGERWVLVGPNGAGKTCLLEALVGLRVPSAGSVRYPRVEDCALGSPAAARHRAFLPQHVEQGLPLSVYQLVLAARHPHQSGHAWESVQDRRQVEAALHQLDLLHLARRDLATLSGGERQRAALAAILAQEAPLLLLDEPLNHLDPRQQRLWLATLLAACAAPVGSVCRGFVCSLHDLDLARRIASHAILLDGQGGCRAGSAADVLAPAHLAAAFGIAVREVEVDGQCRLLIDPLS